MLIKIASQTRSILVSIVVLVLFSVAVNLPPASYASAPALNAGLSSKQHKIKEDKNKTKDNHAGATEASSSHAPTTIGTPAIRQDRGDISTLDLTLGIGSVEGMPKPPFQFEKEDTTGTNPKIKVKDANGVKWNVKFDEEVHAEIAASRLVWALGYNVEESYFVPSATVNGVTGLGRAKKFVGANGAITNALFEKRPDTIARRKEPWSWTSNPFTGTKELSGLVLLNVLVNNWDAKQENNGVLGMFDKNGGVNEWYTVCDWGGTFGKYSSVFSHSKWTPSDFQGQSYIDGVSGNTLKLHYKGKMAGSRSVPLEHAKWFAGLANQLTDEQIRQAFKAAGASESETVSFSIKLRERLNELKKATGQ
jgi:hypothetical protein